MQNLNFSQSTIKFCDVSGLHWVYNEAVDHSALTRVSSSVIMAVANCTRPLFDCDDDDDDSNIDRLVIDVKEEDTESVSDELQYSALFQENGICDNFDKCCLPSVELVTHDNIKRDISTLPLTESFDENMELCSQSAEDKPSTETDKLDIESPTRAVETAKVADLLTDEMFIRWPAASTRVGAGLQNLGNTCFVNATIQCLTYTVPLVNYLLSLNHSASCKFCFD